MRQIWEQFVGFFETALTTLADLFSFGGDYKWALAIVGLTLISRALLLPLAIKQIRSMRETQRLQPEIQRLRQKYKNDRQRQMQEMQQLYQREGVNPYASCLPMIAQAPVFTATYFAIRNLEPVLKEFSFLGSSFLAPAFKAPAGWLLLILMTLAQLLSTRQLNPGQTDQQKRMQMLMPLMFLFFFYRFPIALVLYWTTSNIFQLVQQLVMTRDMRPKGSGWRGLLGIDTQRKGKGGKGSKGGAKGGANKSNGQQPKGRIEAPREKVQVSAPSAPVATSSGGYDPLASRRSLEEKRQRRRRKKKKRKR